MASRSALGVPPRRSRSTAVRANSLVSSRAICRGVDSVLCKGCAHLLYEGGTDAKGSKKLKINNL
ncbi:hypothetical protein EMIT053CA3_30164 [Pseudomonas donghuensis]